MSKVRVYFDADVLPIVDNILQETGLKTYTDVVNWMIKKYNKDFVRSYNQFLTDSDLQKPQTHIGSTIELSNLESFKGQ